MRAIRTRTARNASRTFQRNTIAPTASSGTTRNVNPARRASMQNSAIASPSILNTSRTSAAIPAENISETFSTSLVARVTSRPTGIVSKKPRWRRWMWANTSRRRSRIAAWPVRAITSGSMYETRPESAVTAK